MADWVLATSIQRLIGEVKAKWPGGGDPFGTIGDAAHASRWSDSDHNPWLNNTVRAVDISINGIEPAALAEFIRQRGAAGAPQLANGGYVIYNRRIASAKGGWAWRNYTGSNPHTGHLHVSVSRDPSGYNSTASWGLSSAEIDLDELPTGGPGGGGVVTGPGSNPYIPAELGVTTVEPSGAWAQRDGYRVRGHRLTWTAGDWVSQRLAEATVEDTTAMPMVQDSAQNETTTIVVNRFEVANALSGCIVNYVLTGTHTYYDAHWNVGWYVAPVNERLFPRAGYRVHSGWSLYQQLQILDGVGSYAGQLFIPSNQFTLAALSDWCAYGDLKPDIWTDENRTRTGQMEILSIVPASGISGPLRALDYGILEAIFEGAGKPGQLDIQRATPSHSYTRPSIGGGTCDA